MASSPPAASPIVPTLALPKKRPSLAPPGPPASAKRRKPSTGPSSLRQTSFPPEGPPSATATPLYSRSPSVESSLTTSVVNGTGGGKKRKKRRGDDDAGSVTGTSVRGGKAGSGIESAHADEGGDDAEDDEGQEGEAVDTVLEGGGKMDEAAEKQFREHLSMLIEALDDDQAERYDIWRRVKLKKEIVRRITNQTLSQSVPASVVTTINGYTKLFIGALIDRARTVQSEWLVASPTLPTGEPNPAYKTLYPSPPPSIASNTQETSTSNDTTVNGHSSEQPSSSSGSNATIPNSTDPSTVNGTSDSKASQALSPPASQSSPSSSRSLVDKIHERDRGPLTPDHLREALRRYKRDREGGAAGFVGLSLAGREHTAARFGGRKLFR